MNKIVNDAIIPLINHGKLSINKIKGLIDIKEFIERVATHTYLEQKTTLKLKTQYGVEPDIVTWGDYFQTELALEVCTKPEDESMKLFDTVKFDIMSAYEIFVGKSNDFYEWLEDKSIDVQASDYDDDNVEVLEILHLQVLKDYFCQMGLVDYFTSEEKAWYNSFYEELPVVSQ
jgi:hypothetical protein